MEEAMKTIMHEMSDRGGGVLLVVEPRPGSDMENLYSTCLFTGDGVTPDLVGSIIEDMKAAIVRNLKEK